MGWARWLPRLGPGSERHLIAGSLIFMAVAYVHIALPLFMSLYYYLSPPPVFQVVSSVQHYAYGAFDLTQTFLFPSFARLGAVRGSKGIWWKRGKQRTSTVGFAKQGEQATSTVGYTEAPFFKEPVEHTATRTALYPGTIEL